ncbi:MAG: hypothetical protein IIA48_06930, partial [Bacteroidetes bacterium]|nr:hypothetical protein [Bacteroidota bacterium]
QAKKTVTNVSFFFLCMSLSLWLFSTGFVYLSNNPQTALVWYRHFVFLGVINIMPSIYLFSVATAGFLKQQKFCVLAGFIIAYTFYMLALTTDKVIGYPKLYFWGYYPQYQPLTFLFLFSYFVLFIAAQVNLWVAYRRETVPIKKTQIFMMIISYLIGFTASIDFVAKIWSIPVYPFGFISSFIFVCLIAYSIIRHKAFDIETVLHKTILWILSFSIIAVPIFLLYQWFFPVMKNSVFLQLAFGIMSFIVFTL